MSEVAEVLKVAVSDVAAEMLHLLRFLCSLDTWM